MSQLEINCYYADLCHSDFLQDSYSRDNQVLLVASCWEEMTIGDLKEQLIDEINGSTLCEKIPTVISDKDIDQAIDNCFEWFSQDGLDRMLSWVEFPELDKYGEYKNDFDVYFYFYLEWKYLNIVD